MFESAELGRKVTKKASTRPCPRCVSSSSISSSACGGRTSRCWCCSLGSTAPARARPSTCSTSGWTRAGSSTRPTNRRARRRWSAPASGATGGTCRPMGSSAAPQRVVLETVPGNRVRQPLLGRVRQAACRDRGLRAGPGRRRRSDPEVLDAPQPGPAEAAVAVAREDKLQSWRITETDWRHWKSYDRYVEVAEHTIRATSTARRRG